ncbi:efflux RND transporter periplasmic adaptor subunit [Chloroflexi bacterium TSY]|nr:efflux RND transporter periplasmic adaptor subunit [Chloroflexi bacterium TSY]
MNRLFWIAGIILVGLIGAAVGYFANGGFNRIDVADGRTVDVNTSSQSAAQPEFDPANPDASTVEILPADALVGNLSAAGNIALQKTEQVVLQSEGAVSHVAVKAGDVVQAGDLLLSLATTNLQRVVDKTEIDFENARLELEKLGKNGNTDDIAMAQAELLKAQENLVKVQAGPSEEELAAARSNVNSGWAKYSELLAQPTDSAISQALATLKKAEVDLREAQHAYDEISWLPESAASSQAQDLQRATIDYEAAKAAFDEANQPASQSDLQSAISTARQAEDELRKLREQPTLGEVAEAEAQVVEAGAKLTELQSGSYEIDLRTAELNVKKAMIDLVEAQTKLAAAQIYSSMDGTVLEVKIQEGARGATGDIAVTMADVHALELTINVAEVDIPHIRLEQEASVEIDALRGQIFSGVVTQISPTSQEGEGVVNYPVTIRLNDEGLDGVRPGMTAVATLAKDEIAPNSWLVPTNGLVEQNGRTMVQVVSGRDDEDGAKLVALPVTVGEAQGEWTVVESDELKAGDRILGSVASYIDEDIAREFTED